MKSLFRVLSRRARSRWRSSSSFGLAATAAAQGVSVSGRLYHSVSSKPIADATVAIEGTTLETKSAADGSYSIPNVPTGPHHLLVIAKGFVPARSELTVAQTAVTLDVAVDPELHYSEVVSVSPDARSQFDSYQPTTVLAGQDLAKQLGARSARRWRRSPVSPSARSAPARRGRSSVASTAIACLSSMTASGSAICRVSRATMAWSSTRRAPRRSKSSAVRRRLLYGSNAIGGLVNVISDTIPDRRGSTACAAG